MEIRNRIQENQNAIKFNELSIDWNEIILKKDKIKVCFRIFQLTNFKNSILKILDISFK